jgi:hypothetical protein
MKVRVIGGTRENETTTEDKYLSVLLAAKGIKQRSKDSQLCSFLFRLIPAHSIVAFLS